MPSITSTTPTDVNILKQIRDYLSEIAQATDEEIARHLELIEAIKEITD